MSKKPPVKGPSIEIEEEVTPAQQTVRIRNNHRSQWFIRFPVNSIEARIAEDTRGCKVEHEQIWPTKGNARNKTATVCTVALGDREAHEAEVPPEVDLPAPLWAALQREPSAQRTLQGLEKIGEVSVYSAGAL